MPRLFGVQMYNSMCLAVNVFRIKEKAVTNLESELGYQWASTVLGFIALAMTPFRKCCTPPSTVDASLIVPIAILFFKFGKRIRGTSRFAHTS